MQQQSRVMDVVSEVYDHCETGDELNRSEFFYACRKKFDNLVGMDKEQFFAIVDKALEEYQKPLVRASYKLAKTEQRLKEELVTEAYQQSSDEPDEIRRLNGIVADLRADNPHKYIQAIRDASEFCSDDLKAECLLCWPGDLSDPA